MVICREHVVRNLVSANGLHNDLDTAAFRADVHFARLWRYLAMRHERVFPAGMVASTIACDVVDASTKAFDAAGVEWCLHLPPKYSGAVDADGRNGDDMSQNIRPLSCQRHRPRALHFFAVCEADSMRTTSHISRNFFGGARGDSVDKAGRWRGDG